MMQYILNTPQHVLELLYSQTKNNICVFQVSRPYLGFRPDPKHFIVDCEQNVKFAKTYGGKCIEKCNS